MGWCIGVPFGILPNWAENPVDCWAKIVIEKNQKKPNHIKCAKKTTVFDLIIQWFLLTGCTPSPCSTIAVV